MRVELGDLGFDQGGALLVKRALRLVGPGGRVAVSGSAPELQIHLGSWRRVEGHKLERVDDANAMVTAGSSAHAGLRPR